MKGKLIKSDIQYRLHNEEGIVIATSTDGKLSIKNCEAIANGYDLDELAILCTTEETTFVGNQKMAQGFIKGFQKALAILGDKKFSENDMGNLWDFCTYNKGTFKEVIQSLRQTEWDVEIEMKYLPSLSYCNKCQKLINPLIPCTDETKSCGNWRPKLDSDGCLILKRL